MPSPPLRPLQRRIDLREHFEDAGQLLGGDADAGVSHPDYGVLALRSTVSQMRPPCEVNLQALFSRLPTT